MKISTHDVFAADGTKLFVRQYLPDSGEASRTVFLVHGYAEHSGRYEKVATQLVAAGFRVVAPDVRGHGRSAGPRGHVMRFEDYHDDFERVIASVDTAGTPTAVFGHSHGGLISSHFVLTRKHNFKAIAMTSPFLGLAIIAPAWKLAAAKWLSKLAPRVSLPTEIKPEWVCRDPEVVKLYSSDPLNHHVNNSRWFIEAMRAIDECQSRASQLRIPAIILQAGDDKLVSADAAGAFARKSGAEYHLISGAYHELLFEKEGPERTKKIIDWLLLHTSAS